MDDDRLEDHLGARSGQWSAAHRPIRDLLRPALPGIVATKGDNGLRSWTGSWIAATRGGQTPPITTRSVRTKRHLSTQRGGRQRILLGLGSEIRWPLPGHPR